MSSEKAKDMAGVKSRSREVLGVVFIALCAITFLAFLTYNPDDVGWLRSPPHRPTHNLIGPVGAWTGFVMFLLFGLAAYTLPVFLLLAGLFGLIRSEKKIWPKTAWFFGGLMALSTLFDLEPALWDRAATVLNIGSPGGVLGHFLAQRTLGHWFGRFGAGILAAALLMVATMFITHIYPTTLFRWGVARWKVANDEARKARLEEEKQKKNEEREEKRRLREQKKVERMEARAEKERLKREKLEQAAQVAAQADPEESDLFGIPAAAARPVRARAKKTVPEKPVVVESESAEETKSPEEEPARPVWTLPPMNLLNEVPPGAGIGGGGDTVMMAQLLQKTLNDFGIDAAVTNVQTGPVVTCYEVKPAAGVKVEKITGLSNNIALALKAKSVRVQAPIPGRDVVGVEIPNAKTAVVYARQMIDSDEFRAPGIALPLNLGVDVGGIKLIADIAKMPHLLIAGATGAGKTVCMNSLLAGLLMTRTPEELRLMLVDPKIVEFQAYNDLPHLVVPVITDPKKVALGLRWAIKEMEGRYKMFAKVGVRNIEGFNSRPKRRQTDLFGGEESLDGDRIPDRIPYIVIIIDELADLMMTAQAEIEGSIARLAQLSRATGIHMIIATQRPSVNVITGTIKANFPARVAFQVAQQVDSKTILDGKGAESLLGRGDMLYSPPGGNRMIRAQGALTEDEEIERIVAYWKEQGRPEFIKEVHQKIESASRSGGEEDEAPSVGGSGGGFDLDAEEKDKELLEAAIEVLRQTRRASTSSIQRRLRIGYNRAARLMDQLEEQGIIGPPTDTGPRDILIDFDGEIPQNPNEENPVEGER